MAQEYQDRSFNGILNLSLTTETMLAGADSARNDTTLKEMPPLQTEAVALLSLLFCLVGVVGLTGNFLVVYVIMADRKMRNSVTNMLITNLAIADLLIMLFGIPEIVQFMVNRGWLLGIPLCKFQRYVLCVSLYASIMTLLAVCVER